jgi:hypothetical protein
VTLEQGHGQQATVKQALVMVYVPQDRLEQSRPLRNRPREVPPLLRRKQEGYWVERPGS